MKFCGAIVDVIIFSTLIEFETTARNRVIRLLHNLLTKATRDYILRISFILPNYDQLC